MKSLHYFSCGNRKVFAGLLTLGTLGCAAGSTRGLHHKTPGATGLTEKLLTVTKLA